MSLSEELKKLSDLHNAGDLSSTDFERAKEKLLARDKPKSDGAGLSVFVWGVIVVAVAGIGAAAYLASYAIALGAGLVCLAALILHGDIDLSDIFSA